MTSVPSFWVKLLLLLVKSLQSYPTLCDPIDGSPPGSPVPGIFQARALEWVAISFFNAWKWKVKGKSLSRVQLFATPWKKHQKLPGGFSVTETLRAHKFGLIWGLLPLKVSGREVKGDSQPCDRWFGWRWEHSREETENHKVISSSTGHRIKSPGETDVVAQW